MIGTKVIWNKRCQKVHLSLACFLFVCYVKMGKLVENDEDAGDK